MKARKGPAAETGIAILIKGGSADLLASLHAIELAKRTTNVVHAVVVGVDGENNPNGGARSRNGGNRDHRIREPLLLAAWLGRAEGVKVSYHTLIDATEEELLSFFRAHRIFCLIIGAPTQLAMQRESRWVEDLRSKLVNDANWYLRSFWVLVTEPWSNTVFDRVVEQLHPQRETPPDPLPKEAIGPQGSWGVQREV